MSSTIIPAPAEAPATDSKRGIVDLAEAAEAGDVVFDEVFAGVPSINLTVMTPNGTAAALLATHHTPSAAGFSYTLGAPTPAAGYKLHWHAIY